ncbi:hypothetical protein AB0J35_18420 [Nonomuraea angiospora]|uniref:hypothetical protein n=1 Tax=Nonomuraea angiospora TaxID=46172 RepID=UPI00343AB9BB
MRPIVTDEFWAVGIRIVSAAAANAVPVAEFTFAQVTLALEHGHRFERAVRRLAQFPSEPAAQQRRIFREQQEEARPRLRPLLRYAYEREVTSDWSDLLRRPQDPELDLEGGEGLLEAATPETYLAVSRSSLPSARA